MWAEFSASCHSVMGVSQYIERAVGCVHYVVPFGEGSVMVCREMCGLRSGGPAIW